MEKPVQIPIQSLQHVGIPVSDIKISEKFYEKLGFSKVMHRTFIYEGEEGICVMMKREGVTIELYQLPEKELPSIKARKDGHIDHIAFDVPDIDAAFKALKSGGFRIIEDAPVKLEFWERGCRYFNICGPDDERLEFNQIL
ncbi:MAG: VOC family protein [Bacteroidetes bacterium]|nr:VOC family protein [Bacteroidota bacterium]